MEGHWANRIIVQHEEEEKKRYSKVEKVSTQFNVIPPIKQIVCTSTGEGGKTLLNFGEA